MLNVCIIIKKARHHFNKYVTSLVCFYFNIIGVIIMAENQAEILKRVQSVIKVQTDYQKESHERVQDFKEALDEEAQQRQEELQKYLEESARRKKKYSEASQARNHGTESAGKNAATVNKPS